MKKLLVLVSALIVAAACGAPKNQHQVAPGAKPAETKPNPSISESDVSAREKQVWSAVETKNYDAFAALLASDYLEVNSIGVFDKAATLTATRKVSLSDVSFSDWKILPIDKLAVLVTYTASFKGTYDGKPFPATSVRASSAWVNRDGQWLSIYHQETDVAAPPAPQPSPSAKNGASPTVKAAQTTTGSDPVTNEKMVWAALKDKDYDGFAAFLAPEAIEVGPEGVYNKAESVKGVAMFDASKTSLSDWKTVTLDDDASLVTYVVTIPGAKQNKERHTTIWVNRGRKAIHPAIIVASYTIPVQTVMEWMTLFHQSTR